MVTLLASQAIAQKTVIAHRGASGYLPEHTLEAKAMAYAMGADYIEQDVVMTKDDVLIVLHDITLDRTTDVADKFPLRVRDDGRFYAIDFTIAEIRTLSASEGFNTRGGVKTQSYKNRFPLGASSFSVPTFAEEIELIQGLNRSTGRDVGIYPEVKSPEFHREAGKDISTAVVNMLKDYGYTSKQHKIYLQTFSFEELKIIHDEILPAAGVELKLVQLVGAEAQYQWLFEAGGMSTLAQYADGLGPEKGMIIDRSSTPDNIIISDLVTTAHANGLQVHPYTFRLDEGQLPAYVNSFEEMLEQFLFHANIDGVFTDFPDRAVEFIKMANP